MSSHTGIRHKAAGRDADHIRAHCNEHIKPLKENVTLVWDFVTCPSCIKKMVDDSGSGKSLDQLLTELEKASAHAFMKAFQ